MKLPTSKAATRELGQLRSGGNGGVLLTLRLLGRLFPPSRRQIVSGVSTRWQVFPVWESFRYSINQSISHRIQKAYSNVSVVLP
jgi:hypothetical protein